MGLGKVIATAYVRAGLHVALLDQAAEALAETVAELRAEGGVVEPYLVDLRDPAATTRAAEQAVEALGQLDVLVSNAGVLRRRTFEEHTLDDWQTLLDTNLLPAFVLAKTVFPYFRQHGGGVMLFVSSASGILGFVNESAYCASKHGLEGLMKCLAIEGKPHNIRVNTVTPGHAIRTPLSEANYLEEEKKMWIDPMLLAPAFVELATTPLSGERLNAWRISERLRSEGSAA